MFRRIGKFAFILLVIYQFSRYLQNIDIAWPRHAAQSSTDTNGKREEHTAQEADSDR